MGRDKPDFTAITSTEPHRYAYQKKALAQPEVTIGVRRLVDQFSNRPFWHKILKTERSKLNEVNCVDYRCQVKMGITQNGDPGSPLYRYYGDPGCPLSQ